MSGIVYTVGHSTRTQHEFIALMAQSGVAQVADVRSIPHSRHNPSFDISRMPGWLGRAGIAYVPMPDLGGFRDAAPDSPNTGWRSAAFRGYADYMGTPQFEAALARLIAATREETTAIMCAEAVPWRCHRSLIGDALVVRGIEVDDIIGLGSVRPHRLTPFAHVDGERLTYPAAA